MTSATSSIIQIGITIAVIFLVFFVPMWFLFIRKEIAVGRAERMVQREAISGNPAAMAIFQYKYIKYDHIPVVEEALKGNKNAIEILGIERYIKEIKEKK